MEHRAVSSAHSDPCRNISICRVAVSGARMHPLSSWKAPHGLLLCRARASRSTSSHSYMSRCCVRSTHASSFVMEDTAWPAAVSRACIPSEPELMRAAILCRARLCLPPRRSGHARGSSRKWRGVATAGRINRCVLWNAFSSCGIAVSLNYEGMTIPRKKHGKTDLAIPGR
jgi:hypothetical protein